MYDNVMNNIITGRRRRIQWIMMDTSDDLDFADDIYFQKDGVT
jgi:hypothetical protein